MRRIVGFGRRKMGERFVQGYSKVELGRSPWCIKSKDQREKTAVIYRVDEITAPPAHIENAVRNAIKSKIFSLKISCI